MRAWRDALAVYRKPVVLRLFFFGVSAGLPFLLVFSTLTAWLADSGIEKSTIGFFGWIGITYSVKVFWSPIVDHLKLPLLNRWLGQRRSWIMLAQLGIAYGLFAMSNIGPHGDLFWFAVMGVLVAFSSATQDIAIDAYRIEVADDDLQAALSAAYVFGYRVALLIGGAGAFYLADFWSWQLAYQAMALLAVLLVLITLLSPSPAVRRAAEEDELVLAIRGKGIAPVIKAVLGPFVDFVRRYGRFSLVLLLLVGCYRISDIIMGAMANPFYLELGFSKIQIADVTKIFGFFMTILGSFVGGLLVARYGIHRILVMGAILVAVTNLLFAWLSVQSPDTSNLAIVVSMDNFSGGLAIVAFIAFLSSLTNQHYTATQYALFSSLMTLPGKFVSGFSGVMVEAVGFMEFFLWAAVMGIPAILLSLLVLVRQRRLQTQSQPD